MKLLLSSLVILMMVVSNNEFAKTAFSQEISKGAVSNPNMDAIKKQSTAFVNAFNKQDAKTLATFWTDDAEYVDENGSVLSGRSEIEKGFTEYFSQNPKAKMEIAIESLRSLSPMTVIEDGISAIQATPDSITKVRSYTAVHVKIDDKWMMASVRDERTQPTLDVTSAADLEWLVGNWVAEEHGVKIDSEINWTVDERFLKRVYTTTQVDGSTTSGLQIIGWNPMSGNVQSWDFSPDGGHAIGIWTPIENGWLSEVHGTTGEGAPTTAVNVLRSLDENAYVWQSVQRSLGEIVLPDTDQVVIKRK